MIERTWRLDSVVAQPATGEMTWEPERTVGPTMGPTMPADAPSTLSAVGFFRQRSRSLQTWARERIKRFGGSSARFESLLHELSAIIESTDNPATVEMALVRLARQLVPACRIELITGGESSIDRADNLPRDFARLGNGQGSTCPDTGQSNPSFLEVPLRCGSTIRGRLRIRSRTGAVASLSKETIRRLATLCGMSACALDRLSRHQDWPWDDDVAHLSSAHELSLARRAGEANSPEAFLLHDATFLNAVLPFALNQARRHREPLSLVCVAIDRLGGIQELLGRAAVERLVCKVGETVASLIRASDIVARLDDDRVVAVLPRAPGGGALNVAQKICRAVMEKSRAECEIPSISVSIGVATFPSCADTVFSLFDAADEALARAQYQGRNQAVLASPRTQVTSNQSRACSPP